MVDQQICTHCNCMKKTLETWVQTSFKNLLTNIFHFIQSRHLESCMHLPEQSLASVEEVSCVPEKLLHAIYFDINMSNQKPTARNKQHLITNMPKHPCKQKIKCSWGTPGTLKSRWKMTNFWHSCFCLSDHLLSFGTSGNPASIDSKAPGKFGKSLRSKTGRKNCWCSSTTFTACFAIWSFFCVVIQSRQSFRTV